MSGDAITDILPRLDLGKSPNAFKHASTKNTAIEQR